MYDCPRLPSPDFRGLVNIDTIGHGWMYQCSALVSPTFNTRIRLKEVVTNAAMYIVNGLRLLTIGRTLIQY